MITREQCLKWVEEVADPKIVPPLCDTFVTLTYSEFDSLCQRVWNEAIESAAKRCLAEGQADELNYEKRGGDYYEGAMDTSYLLYEEIRELKVKP